MNSRVELSCARARGLAAYARHARALTDFLCYVEAGRSGAAPGGVMLQEPASPPRSLHPSGVLRPLPGSFRPRRFPLDNREWTEFLEGRR